MSTSQLFQLKQITSSLTSTVFFFFSFLQIRLGPEEFIVEVSGTIHPWGHLPNAVYSLTLVTNTGTTYGPFGTEVGAAFHIPVQSNSRIVGFFAHGKNYIEGIGAYIRTM